MAGTQPNRPIERVLLWALLAAAAAAALLLVALVAQRIGRPRVAVRSAIRRLFAEQLVDYERRELDLRAGPMALWSVVGMPAISPYALVLRR